MINNIMISKQCYTHISFYDNALHHLSTDPPSRSSYVCSAAVRYALARLGASTTLQLMRVLANRSRHAYKPRVMPASSGRATIGVDGLRSLNKMPQNKHI